MSDIVDRLNDSLSAGYDNLSAGYSDLRKEAAVEIMRLRAKIKTMEQQERIFDVIERTWYKQGLDICGASLSYFMADLHSTLEKSK